MTDFLVVGRSSWIIQDGNYGNFSVGVDAAFSLEVYPSAALEQFEPEATQTPGLIHTGSELVGHVVHTPPIHKIKLTATRVITPLLGASG